METRKKVAFSLVLFLIAALSIELASQVLYRVKTGYWSYRLATEKFDIREFNVRVEDERTFTLKPGYRNDSYGKSDEVPGYRLSTDGYGFREGTHRTDLGCPSVVFLGDSVPFGWGLEDRATLPSKFHDRLAAAKDPRCVINAAAPSYSLFQAVARFRREIAKKAVVDSVYFQIYDPASQVVFEGRDWKPSRNWASLDRHSDFKTALDGGKYGAAAYFVFKALVKARAVKGAGLDADDEATLSRFAQEVRGGLEDLFAAAEDAAVRRVVVAPVTVPKGSFARLSSVRKKVLSIQNGEFRRFAERHPGKVEYLDTEALLAPYEDSDAFLDACCHMSERGCDAVAAALFERLKRTQPRTAGAAGPGIPPR